MYVCIEKMKRNFYLFLDKVVPNQWRLVTCQPRNEPVPFAVHFDKTI